MKKNIHIVSHTHWDREWYMPFEHHRYRLVKLIDTCLWLFENDENFHSFFLDGHTVGIEDYLEIKPQNRDKVMKYVKEKRLVIGPWYILQDEFLTSSESNVRNLLYGMKMAKEFGGVSLLGYFPDSFGNAGQMPQLLKQAGIEAIAFGRGVKPTGMNNTVSDFNDYASQFSEMYWESPDGSRLPAILFANWYNNGAQIPAEEDRGYWDERINNLVKYAATDELLLMNGSDHMPVQKDLSAAIKTAQKLYPEYNIIHSSFEKYVEALKKSLPEDLTVIKGELTNQDTDGWWALVNTASAHIYLKQMNRQGEILLESTAEPLCAMASIYGYDCPRDMLSYAWKTLMKNHPHDSICSCSVDAVADEMQMRFKKSRQAGEAVAEEALEFLADRVDISAFSGCEAVFAAFNTYSKEKSGVVSADIDLKRVYGTENLNKAAEEIYNESDGKYVLIDVENNIIPCRIENFRPRFGYDLPEQGFRKPYMAKTVTVTFEACDIPAMGYKAFGLKRQEIPEKKTSLAAGGNIMENENLRVFINKDGTVDLLDKKTGRSFLGLLRYEDVGDLGNEYTFIPPEGDEPIYSGSDVKIELVCDEEFMAEYKISSVMEIPESGDEEHYREQMNYVHFTKRRAGRSIRKTTIRIDTYVRLEKNSSSLKIKTEFKNEAKDHRLRVLIPTGIECTYHKAEAVFDAPMRDNEHKSCWTYPSGCERQQGFVMMHDKNAGLAVSNIGIYEYEILKDNTIALTLLRAVGEMGDWGVFQTELSQCQRNMSLEYEIIPFANEEEVFSKAPGMQYPVKTVQVFGNPEGGFEPLLDWSGNALRMTAFKNAEDSNDIIMRWVNYSDQEQTLNIKKSDWIKNLFMSNVIEEKAEDLKIKEGRWNIKVSPHEIITLCAVKH